MSCKLKSDQKYLVALTYESGRLGIGMSFELVRSLPADQNVQDPFCLARFLQSDLPCDSEHGEGSGNIRLKCVHVYHRS